MEYLNRKEKPADPWGSMGESFEQLWCGGRHFLSTLSGCVTAN